MAKINSLIISIFICACAFVVVHGDDFSWIPAKVPTVTAQCKKACPEYTTQCEVAPNVASGICERLPCAWKSKVADGVKTIRPEQGTLCGPSSVCRDGKCTPIPKEKIPK